MFNLFSSIAPQLSGRHGVFPASMKPFRPLLLGVAALIVLLALGVAAISRPAFQTWAVRKVLAARPSLPVTVGFVAAGLREITLTDVRITHTGAVLVIPLIEARLPLIAAVWSEKVLISQLVAKDWKLDLSAPRAPRSASGEQATLTNPPTPGQVVVRVFAGIFGLLDLPVDFSLGGLQLGGDVTLPDGRGTAKVAISGGGLAANREGKFNLVADFALTDPKVSSVKLRGVLSAGMNSPRTFKQVTGKFSASAQGVQFPQGVTLTADARAEKNATGESYFVAVESGSRELAMVRATYPGRARDFDGTWKLDLRDSDVAPFALGVALPAFKAAGEGKLRTDSGFAIVRASGRVNLALDRLEAIQPQLSSIGAVTLAADFDLAHDGATLIVDRLDATLAGKRPVGAIRALQEFTFNTKTRELQAADPARGLFDLRLAGVPLAWSAPFFPAVALSGSDLQGEFIATPRSGGLTLRSKDPLTVTGLSVTAAGRALLRAVDVSLSATADYAPQGWQADITAMTAKQGSAVLLAGSAKIGMLAGADHAVKATGAISADLPGWLAQPAMDSAGALTKGKGTIEFAASLGATQQVQASVKFQDLVADPKITAESLPVITMHLRADLDANGQMALNAPVLIERAGRKTDLLIAGTILRAKTGMTVDVQLASANFVVDDASILAVALPGDAPAVPTGSAPVRARAAPWAGVNGVVALALKKVIYSDSFQASNVTGTLRITEGAAKLEGVRAGLGESGDANLDGAVTFDAQAARPYALAADLTLTNFDPAPFFRAFNPAQPATVEGRFNVTSKVFGQAATLADLPMAAGGDFQLTSKGGVFRGLPVSVAAKLEATSTLAAGIARLGSLANVLSGRNGKAMETVANNAQAVGELVNSWKAIAFDQLSAAVTRDASHQTELKDFVLISPEIRLSGRGVATHQGGASALDDPIAM
ncbi:MAG: hypothetical protein RIQ93_3049, partial [Verrucomicrobiota bacterium]